MNNERLHIGSSPMCATVIFSYLELFPRVHMDMSSDLVLVLDW